MDIALIVIVILLSGVIIFLLYKGENKSDNKLLLTYIEGLRKEINEGSSRSRQETQNRLDKIDDRLTQGIGSSTKTLQEQFSQNKDIIRELTRELSEIKNTNKQVLGFSEKLQSLENILKNPKQRGILGEYFLESLLSNVLQTNQYKMQYKFNDGELVDAAIFFKDKIIPIDAKFSLEKYNKIMEEPDKAKRIELEKGLKADVKNRIEETSKYIRPDQDTTDFAFMFIPAEGVYSHLLNFKVGVGNNNAVDLIEFAFKKHVIIVSPSSFYAYLETVLQGLKALKMEKSVKEIIKKVGELGKHLNSYEEYYTKVGKHLDTTVNMYNSASNELKKIDKDVYSITDGKSGGTLDPIKIDKSTQT